MAIECPNCRAAQSWARVFFTTAWGTWTCTACRSLLGINTRRRLAVILPLCLVFNVFFFMRVNLFGMPVAWPLLVLGIIGHFLFLERLRVIERTGFRCTGCGYDLRGQVEPRCPECGQPFAAELAEQMKGLQAGEETRRKGHWAGGTGVIVVLLLLTGVLAGLVAYTRFARVGRPGVRETQFVVERVLNVARANAGQAPRHAIRVAADTGTVTALFVTDDSSTNQQSVPLADVTLDQFDALPPQRKQAVIKAAGDALPAGTFAHRLGDFVFTYHGIDFRNADPGLWIVVCALDPQQNLPPTPEDKVAIGRASGKVIRIHVHRFGAALAEQNALRAEHGLPPLPMPFDITHATPAVRE